MIIDFKCSETGKIFTGSGSRKFPVDIQSVARRKLRILNNAIQLQDLRIPPANQLEKLTGNRRGQHSIRINKQWRICFIWHNGQPDRLK